MCKYCKSKDYASIYIPNKRGDIIYIAMDYLYFDNSEGEHSNGILKINFCPMCGRKLKKGE